MWNRIKLVLKGIWNPYAYFQNSFSQAGEDMVIKFLLVEKGIDKIQYLDIGANHPIWGNNTYHFYLRGSKGVCIEADSSLISNLERKRPKDIILNLGVSISETSEAEFYIFHEPGINTFDKNQADLRTKSGLYHLKKTVKVPLVRINTIIAEQFEQYPDLLSLDIEGLDLKILEDLDMNRFPIPIICVETCQYSENHIRPKDTAIIDFMIKLGYEIYADTYINTIFVNKSWFYQKK